MFRLDHFSRSHIAIVGFLFVVINLAGCSSKKLPLTLNDDRVLVKISDLQDFIKKRPINVSKEVKSKKKISKGMYKLTYEYKFKGANIQTIVIVTPDVHAAKQKYSELLEGIKIRFSLIKSIKKAVMLKKVFGLFEDSDDTNFFIMEEEEEKPIGNAFVARSGRKIYGLVLTGVYFNKSNTFSKVISPKLALLRSYEP